MRNLVVCCDGTWNTADQAAEGVPIPTNVARLHNALAERNREGVEQLGYYHPGVGTEGKWWERIAGGALGLGLEKNIMSGYRWLAGRYRPGDRIFLFGFSRGAFTVRSLAGMVAKCGLLDLSDVAEKDVWGRVERAYARGYRKLNAKREDWCGDWKFHQTPAGVTVDETHFIGVWDTVGALGVPDDLGLLNLIDNPQRFAFHNTDLSDKVKHARHAVALDERRASFTPTLWTEGKHDDLLQVWFPGVHSDVGGGYPHPGLANNALDWMMTEVEGKGLDFHPGMRKQVVDCCDVRDVLHQSVEGGFAYLATQPRAVPRMDGAAVAGSLHASVQQRRENPPITQAPYRKSRVLKVGETAILPIFAREHWNDTNLYLEPGARYEFSAAGEWLDRNIACGPGGTSDGKFQAAEFVHMAGALLGKVEEAFRIVVGNDQVDFKGTKRHERMPWFVLVGAIANNDGKPGNDGTAKPHETFKIGNGCTYPAKGGLAKGGYLHCYANDSWLFYDNNRGSVTLTVKRVA